MYFFKKLHLSVSKSLYSINGLRLSINQASLIFCIRLAPLAGLRLKVFYANFTNYYFREFLEVSLSWFCETTDLSAQGEQGLVAGIDAHNGSVGTNYKGV